MRAPVTCGVSPHRRAHPVQRDTLVRASAAAARLPHMWLCARVRLRGRCWVSQHGIPRLKKIQKERKCLLSIVAGFPFAKQLRAPTHTHAHIHTHTHTHIRGGTKSHHSGAKTRMSAQV